MCSVPGGVFMAVDTVGIIRSITSVLTFDITFASIDLTVIS